MNYLISLLLYIFTSLLLIIEMNYIKSRGVTDENIIEICDLIIKHKERYKQITRNKVSL